MILNAYAVLDVFTSLLRLLLGLLVIGLGLPVWWQWKASVRSEGRGLLEDRSYLVFLLALLLVALNLASWPLFYLLLQSYVPEWPDVMCIYGVTQVGAGSLGPSRFLPGLLTALQMIKPVLVFLTGAWLVLYWVNRSTATGPLLPRVLLVVIALGLFAVVDSVIEGAYLVIPKKEEFLSAGCCMQAFDARSRTPELLPRLLAGADRGPWLYAAYYGINVGMCLALAVYVRLPQWRRTGARLAPLCLGALVSLPVNLVFLIEIASPALLHMPHHHCPYDLVSAAPESMAAVALFVVGSFSVGWACTAGWFGTCAETRPFLGQEIGKLLRLGFLGYVASTAMLSVELILA
ncbi:MAG TPA: hypothetical protein VG013_05600 [Gemmataceae bacterium]|nr:hypothetical protein [Gemmataceae bacterium]